MTPNPYVRWAASPLLAELLYSSLALFGMYNFFGAMGAG